MSRVAPVSFLGLLLVVAPASSSVLLPTGWSRAGSQAGDSFARSVAPAGDVDQDGYGDLLVGAPAFDTPQVNAGAAYLYRGGAAGPASAPSWQYLGAQIGAETGTVVAGAGDVNGDGHPDLLVGAPLYNDGGAGTDAGRLDVFFGSASGPALLPSQTFIGPIAGARFGFSAATAGDVDRDGYDDVIVGAPGFSDNHAGEGAAFLFRGGAAGLVASSWSLEGGEPDAQLGYAVSGAGDVDADGYADVLIGAPGTTFNFTAEGTVFVYRGSGTGLGAISAVDLHGFSDSCFYGGAVANAGDVNGDGYADVLIGAPNASVGPFHLGYAEVYGGGPFGLGTQLWGAFGIEERENFGVSVATAGDLNGDDYADFLVGGDRWPSPPERIGRASVWLGGPGLPELDAELQGAATAEGFGFSVATAGDVDNDGFSDLAIGLPGATTSLVGDGRVALWRGSASMPVAGVAWPQTEGEATAQFGLGLAGGVDERNSGRDDLFAAAPLADQGFTDAGKLRVVPWQSPSPVLAPGFVAAGDRAGAKLGTELARAGDVNEDGYEDLLLGSPNYSNGQGDEGVAQVLLGGPAGLASTPGWSYETNVLNDQVGHSVAAGDFDGDGRNDLLVGVFSSSAGSFDGSARVFRGSAAGPEPSPSWTTPPVSGNTWLGFEVATGDWDADGFADAAVGAPSAANGQVGEGQVRVYFGGPGGLSPGAGWILEPNVVNAAFGSAIANAGDVDGDGVGDLLIGAPGAFAGGRAYLFRGSRSRSIPALALARVFAPDVPAITFGTAVAGIGDVDKDGFADVLVGAPQYSGGQTNEGGVWLFRGSDSGGELAPWWKQESNVVEARYGTSLSRMGDANGDGWPDFAVGAPSQGAGGTLHVYHAGGRGRLIHSVSQGFPGPTDLFLWMGGTLPFLSSTTLASFHTLRSPAGRTQGHVELQIGTQNEAWSGGVHTFHGPHDTGAAGAGGSVFPFKVASPGLAPALAWRWRERSTTRSPFFPHSPWRQPRSYETAELHFRTGGTNVAVEGPGAATPGVRLTAIQPSPFRGATRIRYRLARSGDVRLGIYDARGRTVRRVAAARVEAGDHEVVFDGRDEDGHPLRAGVYFVSLDVAGKRDVRKLVRLP